MCIRIKGCLLDLSQQVVTTASVLVDPFERLKGCPKRACYYPQGMAPDQRVDVVVKESILYQRVNNAAALANDDDLYLRQTTHQAYAALGRKAARKVAQTFNETLLD